MVGIHPATVTTWMGEVIEPKWGKKGQYTVQLFDRDDVLLGRAVIALLRRRRGELTLAHAAAIARGELELPPLGHDPRSSPS
jgi:hypothetical protein